MYSSRFQDIEVIDAYFMPLRIVAVDEGLGFWEGEDMPLSVEAITNGVNISISVIFISFCVVSRLPI
jgi:hypothetical protein